MALLCCAIALSTQPISTVHASDSINTDASAGDGTNTNDNIDITTNANGNSDIDSIDTNNNTDASDIFSEEYFFSALPVVFSATRLAQPVSETPVSMTVIDKDMIQASGALEIADLMRLVPGMQVSNYLGKKYFVTYHGRADLYSRSLQVLVDGRSIYDPVIGGVSWDNLPLAMEDINRIEVIRGSNAAAYGSNSFSGVINIITEHPSQQQGTLIKTTVSDKQTNRVLARNAGVIGDLDYRVTVNYDESDGLKSRYDDSTNKWMSLRGDYKVDSSNQISLQVGYSSGTQQDGFPDHDFNIPRETSSSSSFQQIKWTHTADDDSEYSLHFFHNYKEVDDTINFQYVVVIDPDDDPDTDNDILLPFDLATGFGYESHRYELEFQHILNPMPDLRMVWGVGVRHDSSTSPETLNQESAAIRNQIHAFINGEWKPSDNLAFNFGAMLEKYEGFSGLFSPRVALNYSVNENHTFRISHSRAYRMPNVWEEQIDLAFYIANGPPIHQLHKATVVPDPEEINSIELGYMAALETIPLTLDVKLFKERISPTINYAWDRDIPGPLGDPIDDGAGRFDNDGEIEINGLEIQLDYQVTTNTQLHLAYSHTNTSGKEVTTYDYGRPDGYRDLGESVPSETYSLLASHRFDNGVQISSGFYHIGAVTWLEPGDTTDSYNKWDFRIAKKFDLPDATIDVAAILHNITNDDYQEYLKENQAQREFHLQVGVKF